MHDVPRGFTKAEQKAKGLLNNSKKIKNLINTATKKAVSSQQKLQSVWNDLQTLFRLLNAWRTGEYSVIPWKSILYIATALLYLVNPLDVIPDFIPFTGLVDDVSIINFVVNAIKTDLDKFLEWETQHKE